MGIKIKKTGVFRLEILRRIQICKDVPGVPFKKQN